MILRSHTRASFQRPNRRKMMMTSTPVPTATLLIIIHRYNLWLVCRVLSSFPVRANCAGPGAGRMFDALQRPWMRCSLHHVIRLSTASSLSLESHVWHSLRCPVFATLHRANESLISQQHASAAVDSPIWLGRRSMGPRKRKLAGTGHA
jgi:hypothetical protein